MERWESFLDSYPPDPDLRSFGKALQLAEVALKQDLAPFEIEWLLQTLLHSPVSLLATVGSHHKQDQWSHYTEKAYKLLTDIVDRLGDVIEAYLEEIVALCCLPLGASPRHAALRCLTAVCAVSPRVARTLHAHVHNLTEGGCTTERVALVGAICKYHPESATELITDIWRTLLNLMESNKNTAKLTKALLQAVENVFIHFGRDLPTVEVYGFYEKMVNQYLTTQRDVILQIISTHSELFIERLSRDAPTRARLWEILHTAVKDNITKSTASNRDAIRGAIAALKCSYDAVLKVDRDKIESIITAEVIPRTQSTLTQIKYTALRIISKVQQSVGVTLHNAERIDVHALEFELRSGSVSYDTAEAISWCIEAHLPNCENLLQTAILFSHHLPVGRVKEIVVYGILNAPAEFRRTSITFLTNETIQSQEEQCMETHLHTWQSLFNTDNGTDCIVVENSGIVFKHFITYAVLVFENFLEEDCQSLPLLITNLLTLTSYILSLQTKDDHVTDLVSVLAPILLDIATLYESAEAIRALTRAKVLLANDFCMDFGQLQNLHRSRDESTLCAKCELIVECHATSALNDVRNVIGRQATNDDVTNVIGRQATNDDVTNVIGRQTTNDDVRHVIGRQTANDDVTNVIGRQITSDEANYDVIAACHVIFGRNDVEFAMMTKALKAFEEVVRNEDFGKDNNDFSQILNQLENQLSRKDTNSKESRIFRKDLVMFLAKYGCRTKGNVTQDDFNKHTDIIFNVPDHNTGISLKINLRDILRTAIQSENIEILQTLLTIICAEVPTTANLSEYALPRVLLALSRAYSRSTTANNLLEQLTAVAFGTECVGELISYITKELSPGVRKMLSDALETVLVEDRNELLSAAVERVIGMMREETSKKAGLDITETVLTALKESNAQTKKSLPRILELVSNTYQFESGNVFDAGATVFIEKIELFDGKLVEDLIRNLIGGLLEENNLIMTIANVRIYKKTVEVVMQFIKNIYAYKMAETSQLLMTFFEVIDSQKCDASKILYVLSDIHDIYALDLSMSRKVLSCRDYSIQNQLFCMELKCEEDDHFCIEAVFKFMKEYAVILLELQYQKTLEHFGTIIKTLTPICVIDIHKTLSACMSVYKDTLRALPRTLLSSLEEWCQMLLLNDITTSIQKEVFTQEHAIKVKAVKRMLTAFDLSNLITDLTNVAGHCHKWPEILLKLFSREYIEKYLTSKLLYLNDLMTVSVQFLKVTDVKKLLLEGYNLKQVSNEMVGVKFCRFFMSAFFSKLTEKPYILLDEDMAPLSIILYDIVKYAVWKKCTEDQNNNILELVDQLWPTFQTTSNFEQQHSLLIKLNNSCFPKLRPDSNPLLWAVERIEHGDREERARLVEILPGGDEFSQTYRLIASSLPSRLCELSGDSQATLRAMIDALSATGDKTLLMIVSALISGDHTAGWWDTALDSCMASLALRSDFCLLRTVYTRCFQDLSLAVCHKILLPLLRYSPSSICEEFFTAVARDLLSKMRHKLNKTGYEQMKRLAHFTRACILLQVAFEKLPTQTLESPSSALYASLSSSSAKPWDFARETVTLARKLGEQIDTLHKSDDDKMREMYRQYYCASFNFRSAAISRMQSVNGFKQLLDVHAWEALVDDTKWDLPLINTWARRTKLRPVSIEVQSDATTSHTMTSYDTMTSSLTSQRSRMFLRTLSENPLQFDLIQHKEEIKTLEINLSETAVNTHECAATLTALFNTCPRLQDYSAVIVTALTNCRDNVKVLIAQTICNSKEELKPLASSLRAALLAFVIDTSIQTNGKSTLHQLHIDVIETLMTWSEETPDPSLKPARDAVLLLIIQTCMENRLRGGVFNTLFNTMVKWLELYGSVSSVAWSVFEPYLEDQSQQTKTSLFKIITKIVKSRIHLPQLLPILFTKLQKREDQVLMSEIFGLAVNCQQRFDMSHLTRFRKVLEDVKVGGKSVEYVKMLHHAQMGCGNVCDERHFRMTIDQLAKLVGNERNKCYDILSSYVCHNLHKDCVKDMFDTLQLCETIAGDSVTDVKGALELVKAGFEVLPDTLKRRLVNLIAEKCSHNDAALRTAACHVILLALKELLCNPSEPPSKRPRTESTALLSLALGHGAEYSQLFKAVCIAVCVNRVPAAQLLSTDLRMRFKECFALTVVLPLKSCSNTNKNTDVDLSVCTSTFLELLFMDLRSREVFKNTKFREQALEIRQNVQPTKLLSRTRTYHGTFSRQTTRRPTQTSQPIKRGIDVTVPLDHILGSILQFAYSNTNAACALIAQLAVTLQVSGFVPALCIRATPLAPLLLSLASIAAACQTDGLAEALCSLTETATGSESEWLVRYLYRELTLDSCDEQLYGLGQEFGTVDPGDGYVAMEGMQFDLEDITSAFGQLSAWDALTIQQRALKLHSGLPPLWTDIDTFRDCIQQYDDPTTWFGKLVAAYRRQHKRHTLKWLREMDLWPRRYFQLSAVAEAVEWQWDSMDSINTLYKADIQDGDCMVEWAARLMIRTAHTDSLSLEDTKPRNRKLSRSQELQWCERANEMGLQSLVSDCVKRNFLALYESEVLPWLHVHVSAVRARAMQDNDVDVIKQELLKAENVLEQYAESSSPDAVLAMNKLILELHSDLNSLSSGKLQNILQDCDQIFQRNVSKTQSAVDHQKAAKHIVEICQIAMTHYTDVWECCSDEKTQENALGKMLQIVEKVSNTGSILTDVFLDVILDKMDNIQHVLSEDIARKILDYIETKIQSINNFALYQLRSKSHIFPSHLLPHYIYMSKQEDSTLVKYKKCIQTLCDPEHTLMNYCGLLQACLQKYDAEEWSKTFKRLKEMIFENQFAGSDYLLLNRYKDMLYGIEHFDPLTSKKSEDAINTIRRELGSKLSQTKLKLSQLCPALTCDVERDSEVIGKLFGLSGVNIVGFCEQLQVFTQSIRRPVLLIVRTSTGRCRKFLVKMGDDLSRDAASLRATTVAATLGCCPITTYNVCPLSADCGVIQYLEDHQRLRDLVSQQCDLDAFNQVKPPRPTDPILSSARALDHYTGATALMPARALRRALKDTCLANKKSNVGRSAASWAVVGWILGLGDRHLENLLCSQDGAISCVDWAAILQYGVGEIPPARLTRNIVAASDCHELESHMQKLLQNLRKCRTLYLASVRVAFKCMGEEFQQKYPYIKSILFGKSTSYHITKDAILNSTLKHKEMYANLLGEVFSDVPDLDCYTVDQQVSVLLRQCTDPRILSVTRTEWEPWV